MQAHGLTGNRHMPKRRGCIKIICKESILSEVTQPVGFETPHNAKARQSDDLPRFLLSVGLTEYKVFDLY